MQQTSQTSHQFLLGLSHVMFKLPLGTKKATPLLVQSIAELSKQLENAPNVHLITYQGLEGAQII